MKYDKHIIESIKFKSIEVEPWAGEHISDAARNALLVALLHECNVTFDFNANTYTVDYAALRQMVVKTSATGAEIDD